MNLVIVESPTKAKKLTKYLGKDYTVEASVGHIRDLPAKGLGVDIENNFEPTYEVNEDKKKVVSRLTDLAKKAEKIYLATDPDREGEAIAWHIKEILLNETNRKKVSGEFLRATFHEITKEAVLKAINNPEEVNINLVNAQQARRVVDRLVGYKVSPVLWQKIRRGLSAGRVQSVALRMIVEREREIEAFIPEEYWEVDVALDVSAKNQVSQVFTDGKPPEELPENTVIARVVQLEGQKFLPKTESDVTVLRQALPKSSYKVVAIDKKERNRVSLPPFTTSTLQQKAATSFGYSGKQTMSLAQQLYEEGLITYHRTDSVNLSTQSVEMARGFILQEFGQNYLPEKPRYFASNSKNAQEAHEAIRVTEVGVNPNEIIARSSRFTPQHVKLYDLIWRRFIASQMNTAVYNQTAAEIEFVSPEAKGIVRASGSILKFDGWMKLFPNKEDTILPDMSQGQNLSYQDGLFAQKFTQPPARFNDASLIKELEKKGIGRPSTYASIISVIIDRGYIERTQKKFFATQVGMTVSDFLLEHFKEIMDYEFTAEMEEDLDKIALGEKEWKKVVELFYTPLGKKIATVTKEAERTQIPVEKTGEPCPLCAKEHQGEIVIRTGRFGKFKSCSRFPECKFTENIVETVEDVVCPLCQKGEVTIKNTRWGKPFFGCGRYPECNWASWKKPIKGETVTPDEWKVMQAKREERKKVWAERMAKNKKPASDSEKGSAGKSSAAKITKTTKPKSKAKTTKTKATAKKTTTKKVK